MTNDLKFDFEHLLSAIRDGEMPDGSDVNAEKHLDTLVEVLNALDPAQIESLMEATGGVAASHALAEALLGQWEALLGQWKEPEVEVGDAVKSDKFSLSREVMKGARSVEIARQAELRKAANQNRKRAVVKRSVVIGGHKTSVSLEEDFWLSLKHIAGERELTLSDLIAEIDAERDHVNLSSAIRQYTLYYYCTLVRGVDQPSSVEGQVPSSDDRRGADTVLIAPTTSRADWN
jgi:predicted DNA-binding ribbon-helix-helix protein